MAQHDYNIANQSGADFRSDLNNALSAIASTNSGDTEPTTTFANQLWIDTANNVLKIRNEGNSAWITTGISIAADNTFNIDGGTVNGITALSFSSGSSVSSILDEDNLASNSATALATQQSIKAYVDSQVGTVDTLAEILSNGNTTGGTNIAVDTGDDIRFADSAKATFGDSSDLQISHNGTNSNINDTGTGLLQLTTNGEAIQFYDATNQVSMARFEVGGNCSLRHDGVTRIQTTSSGANVVGVISSDGFTTTSGTVLVGTSSSTIDSSNHGALISQVGRIKNSVDVAGSGIVTQAFGTAGEFRVKGDGDLENTNNSYGAISDETLKENIADASPKLEKLKQVQIKTFNLIDHDLKQIGVIAQDLENIFPSLVKDNDDGYKTVKYSVFVPILIKAMQELEQQVEDLTQRLDGE